jgi:alcohol dehydrogenase class IV
VTDAGKILLVCLKHNITSVEGFDDYRVRVDDTGAMVIPEFAGPDVRAICVPTTLSGGEFNPLSGATDEAIKLKQAYTQREMVPVCVVLDPAITVHTPEWLWLSTGVRAVDHATETLASFLSNDFCDGIADSALRLLAAGLPAVKADPTDLDARLKCQIGAWQSMIPIIGGVPMGASHAIGQSSVCCFFRSKWPQYRQAPQNALCQSVALGFRAEQYAFDFIGRCGQIASRNDRSGYP